MSTSRRGQLANARKAKLAQNPAECFHNVHIPDPRDNVANLTEMANFIKDNGTEDLKVCFDTMCALYRGVRRCSTVAPALHHCIIGCLAKVTVAGYCLTPLTISDY